MKLTALLIAPCLAFQPARAPARAPTQRFASDGRPVEMAAVDVYAHGSTNQNVEVQTIRAEAMYEALKTRKNARQARRQALDEHRGYTEVQTIRAEAMYEALKTGKNARQARKQALDEHRGFLTGLLGGAQAQKTSAALGLTETTLSSLYTPSTVPKASS
mmetsp:Transcript_6512/g.20511  ORF Transcript_6512/g.20511 Transcript_6512/m.20511 type:complete len:160 (-) Transcript_6512:128-607(-)